MSEEWVIFVHRSALLWIIVLPIVPSFIWWHHLGPMMKLGEIQGCFSWWISLICITSRPPLITGFPDRNPNVAMGASFSAPEYSIKVADVAKVRTLNAIAKNIL